MEREYQHFCDHCGQKLDWSIFSQAFSMEEREETEEEIRRRIENWTIVKN